MLFGLFKRKQKPPQFSPENQLLLTELEKFGIRYRGQGPYDDLAVDAVVREVSRGLRNDGKYREGVEIGPDVRADPAKTPAEIARMRQRLLSGINPYQPVQR